MDGHGGETASLFLVDHRRQLSTCAALVRVLVLALTLVLVLALVMVPSTIAGAAGADVYVVDGTAAAAFAAA